MKSILYALKDHKKINGTLFYSFEYFVLAKDHGQKVIFVLFNATKDDLEMVKSLFREKYVFNHSYLDDIQIISSVSELYKLETIKNLILDLHSFERVAMFLKGDILCYANEAHEMLRSRHKSITYYGFYDYQDYDVQEKLKFYFKIYAPLVGKIENKVLVSSLRFNYKDFDLPEEIRDKPRLYKQPNSHLANLFNSFDTLYYYHSDPDTNNRLIPECFYYGKRIMIEFNGKYQDSIYLRYNDILQNGLATYTLDESDRMMRDFFA